MPLAPGTRLGPYEILAPIGAGGMGEVYRAKDTKLKRDVALKVLPEAFANDPERMRRFQREAEVLASLNHPNIAAIYGVEDRALIMEMVEGESPKGPMAFPEAWDIASQIAAALEFAHDRGIVHRDLKPANVKITPEGAVKLLDFGLAKAFTNQREASASVENSPTLTIGATEVGVILGTAAYMSPEQGKGRNVDKRADIWAFGVVLYELLTGERLFQGRDISETLAQVLTKEPDLARVPSQARKLLQRCLEKDPKQRLRDIGEARFFVELGPAEAAPSRSRFGWIAVAALAVAGVIAGAGWWRASRAIYRTLVRFSVDLGTDAMEGPNVTASISPDGARLAFIMRRPDGKHQLATRLLDQAEPTVIGGTDGAVDPFFSPDGQWIGFFADSKMKRISVQGGPAVVLCDAPDSRGASWGRDGSIIATLASTPGGGLSRIPESGGVPQALTKPGAKGEATHRWPQILNGVQSVLFTANTVTGTYEDAKIEVLSLKTGQWKVVQQGGYFGRYLPSGHLVYLHQDTLFAVRFDVNRLEVRGKPIPVLENVAANADFGAGQYDFGENGTFVFLSGKSSSAGWPVAWMDSIGQTKLLPLTPGSYFTPRLSPDGKRLALAAGPSAGGDIQVYDFQRDVMSRLTQGQTNLFPVWTPDGKYIVFRSQASGRYSLRWIRADGGGELGVLRESKRAMRPYSISSDGKRLAFAELAEDTGWDLWTLPLELRPMDHPGTHEPALFLRTSFNETEPAFSPDGRWVAYTSSESGGSEVYVRPFPSSTSSGASQWRISGSGGRYPIWSRVNKELFYETPDNRIMFTTYTTNVDTFTSEKPQLRSTAQIFERGTALWNMDLAPDGHRFIVFPRAEGSVHVTFLLNFFDDLRRRVPAGGK